MVRLCSKLGWQLKDSQTLKVFKKTFGWQTLVGLGVETAAGSPWGYTTCNSSDTCLLCLENSLLAKCKLPLFRALLVFVMLLLTLCPWLWGMGGVWIAGDGCGISRCGGDKIVNFSASARLDFSTSNSLSILVTRSCSSSTRSDPLETLCSSSLIYKKGNWCNVLAIVVPWPWAISSQPQTVNTNSGIVLTCLVHPIAELELEKYIIIIPSWFCNWYYHLFLPQMQQEE